MHLPLAVADGLARVALSKQERILKDQQSACEIIALHYYSLSFYFHGL